jgi:hypothetical protein
MSEFVSSPEQTADPVGAVLPSGFVPSGTSGGNPEFFEVWVPQTFPGSVSGGYAQPTLSGNGWGGSNNTGYVFQNDQYNTTARGF